MQKSPEILSDPYPSICEGLKHGSGMAKQAALDKFDSSASPEAISAGAVTAANIVCNKSFKSRFVDVLSGACLNLVGCK